MLCSLYPSYHRCFSALQRAEIAEIFTMTYEVQPVKLSFSALQRAEIAEIRRDSQASQHSAALCFSALQRAEIAEIVVRFADDARPSGGFSALQRAEIAEIPPTRTGKSATRSFSALQRAEIAEMVGKATFIKRWLLFQCSSTSRNC